MKENNKMGSGFNDLLDLQDDLILINSDNLANPYQIPKHLEKATKLYFIALEKRKKVMKMRNQLMKLMKQEIGNDY